MGEMLTRVTLRGSLAQVRHVTPVRPHEAGDLVARVYAQMEQDFGMLAPPVVLHSPAPTAIAACWAVLRESLLAAGEVSRAVKEVVAAAVSLGNSCPYCVDVHAATLRGLTRGRHAAEVAGDRLDAIDDPEVRAVAEWARHLGRSGGPGAPQAPAGHLRELVAVGVVFHYLNRMVNVFLGDSPLPPEVPARARRGLMRLFGLMMTPAARRSGAPGRSLALLPEDLPPEDLLPEDLRWAAGAPALAGAFAGAAALIEEGGERSVPPAVRALVADALARWDGTPPGPSRAWAAEAVSDLPPADRPAGRLALLTAMASYQVDDGIVAEFREGEPGDRALVELTSWAAMAAARRLGARAADSAGLTAGLSAGLSTGLTAGLGADVGAAAVG